MTAVWISLGAVLGAAGLAALWLRRGAIPPMHVEPVEEDDRDLRLARQLVRAVGAPLDECLPAVRHELDLAPHVDDDTILKRAKYHYQQSRPEKECGTWRDRVPG